METRRSISLQLNKSFWQRCFRRETLLAVIVAALCIVLMRMNPGMTTVTSLIDNTMVFADKGFMVLGMMLVLVLGLIDISVASTACLSAVLMAVSMNAGAPFGLSIILALLAGVCCGAINGLLIAYFKELAPMIVTLGTMTTYRGIAYLILGDKSSAGFPSWFTQLGWGYAVPEVMLPISLVVFLIFAVIFYIVMHRTYTGRQIFAYGANPVAAEYNGINVSRMKVLVYTVNGLMAAISGIFLASRLGSTRPNMASGYELDIIAMCVFGGVSTSGGKGNVAGCVLSMLLIGYIRYGMNINNVPGQLIPMVIGALLVIVIAVPNIVEDIRDRRKIKHQMRNTAASGAK